MLSQLRTCHHCTSHAITSQRITAHRIISHHIIPRVFTAHHMSSHHITSHVITYYLTQHMHQTTHISYLHMASHHIPSQHLSSSNVYVVKWIKWASREQQGGAQGGTHQHHMSADNLLLMRQPDQVVAKYDYFQWPVILRPIALFLLLFRALICFVLMTVACRPSWTMTWRG